MLLTKYLIFVVAQVSVSGVSRSSVRVSLIVTERPRISSMKKDEPLNNDATMPQWPRNVDGSRQELIHFRSITIHNAN